MRATASPTIRRTSSGARRSPRAVDPTRSANTAVTTFRSSRISGASAAGDSGRAAAPSGRSVDTSNTSPSGMTAHCRRPATGSEASPGRSIARDQGTLGSMRARYSQWDGTQDPLGPDLSAGDLLDAMSEEILSGQGADQALSRMLRRGLHGRFSGLDALRARLRAARRREEDRLNLEGPLREVAERLNEILETERRTLSFDPSEDARLQEAVLGSLPPDPA